FFFSSRRRHTRCLSDWSSDVCSSDLLLARGHSFPVQYARNYLSRLLRLWPLAISWLNIYAVGVASRPQCFIGQPTGADDFRRWEIGRASCRGRGWMWEGVRGV